MAVTTTTRRYAFQSVHALNTGEYRERLHGHRYFLELSFSGVSAREVDDFVNQNILPNLHARRLQLEPATCEVLVNWIHAQLAPLHSHVHAVCLQETRKNRFVSAQSEARFV